MADVIENKYTALGTLGLPLTFLYKCQIWFFMLLYGKIPKIVDFSETVEVYDVKGGMYSKLN